MTVSCNSGTYPEDSCNKAQTFTAATATGHVHLKHKKEFVQEGTSTHDNSSNLSNLSKQETQCNTLSCDTKHLDALLLSIVLGQLQGALALAGADQPGTDLLLLCWGEKWRHNERPRTDQLREHHQLCQYHLPLLLLPLHCLALPLSASASTHSSLIQQPR